MTELDTRAEAVLAYAPDWCRPLEWLPVVTQYAAVAPTDGSTCLCLDARDPGVDPAVVRAGVGVACETAAGSPDFGDVLLVEHDVDLEAAAEVVTSPDEMRERLGLRPAAAPQGAGAVVTQARAAKFVVDAMQGAVDSAIFAARRAPVASGDPLVTVRIPTYGDHRLLIERALPSVLAGSYRNIEVLVCSDGPQPAVREAVTAIEDSRVRYLELDERPAYPQRAWAFWQTAGTWPVNRLLAETRGDFVAPLDHDDAFTVDHVSALLAALDRGGHDFVFGTAMTEFPDRSWDVVGGMPLRHGGIVHGSLVYSTRLTHMRYDPHAWILDEPGDWNLWRRMHEAGADVGSLDRPVVLHFGEGSSREGRSTSADRETEETAHDVLSTTARDLLGVVIAA